MGKPQAHPQADSEWGEEIGGGSFIKWDEPKVIIGIYESREMVEGKYGLKPRVTLVAADGQRVKFSPPAMLDSRLGVVSFGTKVRIEYDGTASPSKSGQPTKNFSVRTARDAATEVFGKQEIPV